MSKAVFYFQIIPIPNSPLHQFSLSPGTRNQSQASTLSPPPNRYDSSPSITGSHPPRSFLVSLSLVCTSFLHHHHYPPSSRVVVVFVVLCNNPVNHVDQSSFVGGRVGSPSFLFFAQCSVVPSRIQSFCASPFLSCEMRMSHLSSCFVRLRSRRPALL